jgi:vancomycin resistance protein YoaR
MRSTTQQETKHASYTIDRSVRVNQAGFHILPAIAGGLVVFSFLLVALVVGYQIQFSGKIYPGISVAGKDLSGLSVYQATDLILQQVTFPIDGRVAFQDSSSVWIATPLDLGLYLDAETSANEAYNFGRQGNPIHRLSDQLRAWMQYVELPPSFIYDESRASAYLDGIAAQVNRPVVEAFLGLNGIEVDVRSGQVGRVVNVPQTLALVGPQLSSLKDGIIPLKVDETPPVILDVEEQAVIVREILSAPLELVIDNPRQNDPGPWTFDPPTLASMLTIELQSSDQGDKYQVALDSESLRAFLQSVAPDLESNAGNARFIFNDDTHQLELIQSASIGRRLLVNQTVKSINESLASGQHKVSLIFEIVQPQVGDNATAAELGITELVNSETSYFYGSSTSRIQNIQAASARFHGLLVAPGETFSMANALGDVSLDNGYAEALIIFGDRTIKGVGGGVCQVSTTLFRTVFFAGYPVVERYPHAYRVYYYELTASNSQDASLAGLDATVYVPLVDFKFVNDTPNWLLMETYVNAAGRSLTWKFYSTLDGRRVEWDSTGLQNRIEAPEPLYQENPDLSKGEVRQVDWAVEGADVTVTRTVYRDDAPYLDDTFVTHYMPWRAVWEYGPGTEGMPPDKKNKPAG